MDEQLSNTPLIVEMPVVSDREELPPIRLPSRRATQLMNLIIFVAVGIAAMLVWDVSEASDSAQASRWGTVAALVERHSYAIDGTRYAFTVDKVKIGNHLYSSKPPVLPTIVAGEYWLIKTLSHDRLTLRKRPTDVVRIITTTINWLPLLILLILLRRLVGSLTTQLWTQVFTMAVAASSYLVALAGQFTNHTVGAWAAFFAVFLAYRIWYDRRRTSWRFALCGFFAGLATSVELSAILFVGLLFVALLRVDWRRTIAFVILAALPIAGHFYTTHLVTGTWKPQYSNEESYIFRGSYWHRDDNGHLIGENIDALWEPWPTYLFHQTIGHHGILSSQPVLLFSLIGFIRVIVGRDKHRALAVLIAILTIALLIIYTFFTGHRNYGGWTALPRYYLWLFPLWLMLLPVGLSWGARWTWWRVVAGILLAISAASACFAARDAWRFPWQDQLWRQFAPLNY